jgi:light-regulated signal transduction histidine kinase (bacteriophytochrome)
MQTRSLSRSPIKDEHSAQLDDEGRRLLDIVISSGLRMGELIENLLSFSRLSRIGMASTPLDMNALIRISLEEVRHMYPGEHIAVHIGDLPAAIGDSAMVKQVLINLLSNAFKFTKRTPSPVIEVGAVVETPDTVYFVKDNGVGFSMEHAHNLFGVFQRLHSAEEFEGTGVGLALVQRILHRHGGRIWAKAEVNHGATFFFTLPHSPSGAHAEMYRSQVAHPT